MKKCLMKKRNRPNQKVKFARYKRKLNKQKNGVKTAWRQTPGSVSLY